MTKDHAFENDYEFEDAMGDKWTTIPNEIMRAGKDVFGSMGEKMTYFVCLSYSFKIGKEARPSQKTLAHDAICTDRAIRNFLSRLEEKGFLQKKGYHESSGTVVWRVIIPHQLKIKWLEEKLIRAKEEMAQDQKEKQDPEPKPETQEPAAKAAEPDKPKAEPIPFKEIIDYLNEKTGRNYGNVAGNQKWIRARWNEGYTLQDFKTVVDNMVVNWTGQIFKKTGKPGETYLKPATLFGNRFDEYLNDVPKPQKKPLFAAPPKEVSSIATAKDGTKYDLKIPEQKEKYMKVLEIEMGMEGIREQRAEAKKAEAEKAEAIKENEKKPTPYYYEINGQKFDLNDPEQKKLADQAFLKSMGIDRAEGQGA